MREQGTLKACGSLLSASGVGGGITEGRQAGNDTISLTSGLEQVFQEGPDREDPGPGASSALHSRLPRPGARGPAGGNRGPAGLTLPRSEGARQEWL